MRYRLSALLLFIALFFASPASLWAQTEGPHVKITLTPERTHIAGGDGIWVLINEAIDPGWHTYWTNPGDSGAAPRIDWDLPAGFTVQDINWPVPHPITLEGLVSYGYENSATLGQMIIAPDKLPDGKITLSAKIEILVCKDICIPETSTYTLTLNDPAAAPADNTEAVDAFINVLPLKSEWKGFYKNDGENFVVRIVHELPGELGDAKPESFAFMPTEWGLVKNAAKVSVKFISPQEVVLRQARDDRDLSKLGSFTGLVTYTTFDGHNRAYAVQMEPDTTSSAIAPVPAPNPAASPSGDLKKNSEGQPGTTLIQAIILALIGGLILNLMPCVFPVLSIKALSLIKLREKGWSAAARSGLAYTAGVLLTFAVIGGILTGVQVAGGDIGWGFQLQNPAIVLALAYLLFIIGLNFSGLFDISGSFTGLGSSLTRRYGLAGSFFTGMLATIVATPCTAPFMAGALGYALVQPPGVAMAVFLALGLGLSLPYLLLSMVPALSALLPRPGLWMVKFRELLAFPVYASAAWLIWVLAMQAGTTGLMWALSGLVTIAFALWLLAHRPVRKTRRAIIVFIALAALVFAALPLADPGLLRPKPVVASALSSENYTPEKLDSLLNDNRPVFVYMTASWCITCKVNEKIAINTPSTQAIFRSGNVAVLEGDWTSMNPAITAYLKSYGRSGVPLYVFYGAPTAGKRPQPLVLPQILTPGLMQQTIGE